MPTNFYREKLLNTVLFFAKKTKHANSTKIAKLLYFFDSIHFWQTGYPAIGLQYYAFKRGPVPKDFWLEVKDGIVPKDFIGKLALIQKTDEIDSSYKEVEFRAITNPDMSIFTPREIEILNNLVLMFQKSKACEISNITHQKGNAWDITIKEKGENSLMDYFLKFNENSKIPYNEAQESFKEFFEAIHNFHLEPTN